MKIKSIIFLIVLFVALISSFKLEVKAEAKTIVVPDDFASIQDAIEFCDNYDIIFVKNGIYEGPLNKTMLFDKSISLVGEGADTTIINLHPEMVDTMLFYQPYQTHLTALIVEANDVSISSLTINTPTPGGGVFLRGYRTQIIDCKIKSESVTLNGSLSAISGTSFTGLLRLNGSNQTINQSELRGIAVTSSYNNLTKNSISSKIEVEGSFNRISGNNITETQGMLVNGNCNMICNNHVRNGVTGIYLEGGSNNLIFENKITGNWFVGINLGASNNQIFDNYIANNIDNIHEKNGFGISISGVQNNTLYRNTLINNSFNIRILEPSFQNIWDNGSEGNFWDNYTGSDDNSDGIGDVPFILDENNQDNYPIMNPFTIPEFTSWLVLPLFVITMVLIIVSKNKLKN